MINKSTNNTCALDSAEQEILNTPFAELTPELRLQAFSIKDKLFKFNQDFNKNYKPQSIKVTIQDKDILLRNGVKSTVDGKMYGNRRDYNDHLKRHDMVEVGDQAPTRASKEIRGDFECRKELQEAINRHIG